MFFSIFTFILTKTLPRRRFFSILPLFKQKPYQNGCFFLFYPNPNQSLIATKGVYNFCPYFNQAPTKNGVFLYFLPKPNQSSTKKGVFLYFCPNHNQSLTTNDVISTPPPILTKPLPKRVFSVLLH